MRWTIIIIGLLILSGCATTRPLESPDYWEFDNQGNEFDNLKKCFEVRDAWAEETYPHKMYVWTGDTQVTCKDMTCICT